MAQKLSAQQLGVARLLYGLARKQGLPHQRALEFAAASYAESGLNPRAVNKTSGAAGLFQLLSAGYRSRAQAGGGVFNPRANANAILGDYSRFWRSHPGAAPGAAASAVERSGEGAGFYAAPLALLRGVGGGAMPGPGPRPAPGVPPAAGGAPPPDLAPLRQAALQQLFAGFGKPSYDVQPFLQSLSAFRNAQQQAATPAAAQPFGGTHDVPGPPLRAAGPVPPGVFHGNVAGEQAGFLRALAAAVRARGGPGAYVDVTSGYRSPAHNAAVGGVQGSQHTRGRALDGYVVVSGRKIPIGTYLSATASRYGLRSGDRPGFFRGRRDPVHVDAGL